MWKEQIDKSSCWMLFIRLDEIKTIEDVVNRGLPDQNVLKNRTEKSEPMTLSDTAFYAELLQILLYVKKIGIKQRITDPKLTLVLSCWDLLSDEDQKKLPRSEEHTSELQSLMRISYAVFCLKKKKKHK